MSPAFLLRNWLLRRAPVWRVVAVLAMLWWLLDALVVGITQFWWCASLGFGDVWRVRFVASCALFALGIGAGALIWWPLWKFAAPSTLARQRLDVLQQNNPDSLLIRGLCWCARSGIWWLRVLGALLVLRQSLQLANWGDHALLWITTFTAPLETETAGVLRPFWSTLHGVSWSLTTWAWLFAALSLAVTTGFAAVENRDVTSQSPARRLWRVLWFLSTLWFALLASRYALLNAEAAVFWRGWSSWVPGGWNWLSWNWQRPCHYLGLLLSASGALWCARNAYRNPTRFTDWRILACALAAWFIPGVATVVGGSVLSRVVVSPEQTRLEAPFLQHFHAATRGAWNLNDIQSQTVQVTPLPLNSAQLSRLTSQMRLWDEETLRAALDEPSANSPATLNRENGRLIAVAASGIYDATRAVDGRLPLLRALPTSTWGTSRTTRAANRTVATQTAAVQSGEVRLNSWWMRALWAWRWREPSLLWSSETAVAWRGSPSERARALLPLAIVADEAYLAPDGTLLQNVMLSPQTPGAANWNWTHRDTTAQFSGARDVLVMSVTPNGKTAFHANRTREPLLDWWRAAFFGQSNHRFADAANVRASRRFPAPLLETMGQLQAFAAGEEIGEHSILGEYAWQQEPDKRFGFGLQSVVHDHRGRAPSLLWAACDGDAYGKIRQYQFASSRVSAALNWARENSLTSENFAESASGALKSNADTAREVKQRAVRGKVLMVPLWQSGSAPLRVSLGLVQSVGFQTSATFPVQSEAKFIWHGVAVGDALMAAESGFVRANEAVVGSEAKTVWRAWQQQENAPLRNRRDLAQTALQLHDAAQQVQRRNRAQAETLRARERRILENLAGAEIRN